MRQFSTYQAIITRQTKGKKRPSEATSAWEGNYPDRSLFQPSQQEPEEETATKEETSWRDQPSVWEEKTNKDKVCADIITKLN